ncbi:MAG TPA: hypothetical protein VI564_05570 [Candidatus Nanoarchaeia archaeon]|nr:hypothetical protein [Candidatus Nanoarchaeia archaeon]
MFSDRVNLNKKKHFIVFLIIAFIVYILFGYIRPYEQDESQYIIAGKAILNGELNPFKVDYYKHYSNPFQFIISSPLAPLIYGLSYDLGGIFLVRFIAGLFVVLSLLLVYMTIRKLNGDPTLPLILIAFSSSSIVLASTGLLDSIALFFLMFSIYLIYSNRPFFAGLLSGLAMTSKFILIIPILFILIYQFFTKNFFRYILGVLALIIPFLILYRELIPVLITFLMVAKVHSVSIVSLRNFGRLFLIYLPIVSILNLFYIKSKKIKGYRMLFVPAISIIIFQIAMLDYDSLIRHLPYAEFPAAILMGLILKDKKIRFASFIAIVCIAAGIGFAIGDVINYPSYNLIRNDLSIVNGKVLALNYNSFILIKNLPIHSTAENVFSYYYFNYDGIPGSDIKEYERALNNSFFDYATVPSYSSNKFTRFKTIENLVRKYYCPVLKSNGSNGIDIYKKCH